MRHTDELIETLILCGMAMVCHIRSVTLWPLDHLLGIPAGNKSSTSSFNVPVYWKNMMIYKT